MSWLFSQALVVEYSHHISWGCEQSAQLSVMPTQHKFWRNDKMMDFSRLSQFGLTCAVLTEDLGKELLTSYLEDFHARTLVQPAMVQESTETGQVCGQKWHELLVKYDLITCSWKTHQCLFPEDLQESSVILPKWGMTRNGHVFQHQTLVRPISVTECGSWATPQARDYRSGQATRWLDSRRSRNLNDQVAMFPTPKASDHNKRGIVKPVSRNGLPGAVGSGIGGQLNPNWVEWLMGWPVGWTDLKPLETDRFQQWLEVHLNI